MILWGNISHFSVFMVLQMLAGNNQTGMLELKDNEEQAIIYMSDGCVDAVSVPRSDHMLSSRLVNAGYISAVEMRKVMLAAGLRGNEFLGITLLKSGLVDRRVMIRALAEQAYENTLELSNWMRGTFRFIVPREQIAFPVSPHLSVQHLLLETSRRLDEGQRPTRPKATLPGDELCASCGAGCDDEQKDKYLKDGICLWRNMPVVVREAIFSPGEGGSCYAGDEEPRIADLPFL